MPVKTINLEASVERTKSKLRDLLDDPADLFARFDEAVAVSHLSASEGKQAGIAAYYSLLDCIDAAGDADRAEKIGDVADSFATDLRVWASGAYLNELSERKNWCDKNIRDSCVARWGSRGGAHWVELWHGPYDYHYRSGNSCGSVCNPSFPLVAAERVMASMLSRGCFLPDAAKLSMKRVS
jgi:hypothetical protein